MYLKSYKHNHYCKNCTKSFELTSFFSLKISSDSVRRSFSFWENRNKTENKYLFIEKADVFWLTLTFKTIQNEGTSSVL